MIERKKINVRIYFYVINHIYCNICVLKGMCLGFLNLLALRVCANLLADLY